MTIIIHIARIEFKVPANHFGEFVFSSFGALHCSESFTSTEMCKWAPMMGIVIEGQRDRETAGCEERQKVKVWLNCCRNVWKVQHYRDIVIVWPYALTSCDAELRWHCFSGSPFCVRRSSTAFAWTLHCFYECTQFESAAHNSGRLAERWIMMRSDSGGFFSAIRGVWARRFEWN